MTESYEEDTLCKVFIPIKHKESTTQETWPQARVRHAVCYPHLRIHQKIMHTEKHDHERVNTSSIALIHVANKMK